MKHHELFAIATLLSTFGCGGSDAGAFSSASGGSAGASSGGSSGLGGSPSVPLDEQIDPIAVGRKWTYDVEVYGVYAYCKDGIHSGEALSEKELSGKHSYQVQSLCPAAGVSSYAVEGDRVWVYYGGDWILALDAPVQAGHTWSNGTANFTWESAGSVTVPGGTFDDCWTARENVGWEAFTIFCRGVGPIHWHLKTAAGNGFDAQLTEKNF
jgi:hypothetical protein